MGVAIFASKSDPQQVAEPQLSIATQGLWQAYPYVRSLLPCTLPEAYVIAPDVVYLLSGSGEQLVTAAAGHCADSRQHLAGHAEEYADPATSLSSIHRRM